MTISRDSLLTLEAYEKSRAEIRSNAIKHKNLRKVFIGEHVLMQFEDETTIRYQIQEMLRAEKTFDEQGILEELEAYNPLLPEGSNWKVTQMIEYTDIEIRKQKLVELRGIERHTYVKIADHEKVYAVADEDMPRETEEKTSAVHFLRFEFTAAMVSSAKQGDKIQIGIDLPAYHEKAERLSKETIDSLIADFL